MTVALDSMKLPKLITELPGPKSKALVARDQKIMSSSYTRDYPFTIKRGFGALVQDYDDNIFLDFNAGIAVCATGHCHPKVVAAIQKQAGEFIHMAGTDFYYEQQVKVAELLGQYTIVKGGDPRVFLTNSGTEAVEAALKLARYSTGRQNFIAFTGSFHGRTMGSLSFTSSKPVQRDRFAPYVPGVYHVPYAYPYRCPTNGEMETCCQNCTCVKNHIENFLFAKLIDPSSVAGIIVEPLQGEGGYILPPDKFLQDLRALCDKHGILLILDEIQSGMGRSGKMWAHEFVAGVQPDILCTAKGIASGMPMGAIVASSKVMTWVPGSHGNTYGGNPVCCVSAIETIGLLQSELIANARKMGELVKERVSDLQKKHACIGDHRGRGLMYGIEMIDPKTGAQNGKLRNTITDKAYYKGLLLLGCGPASLRLCPPLVVNEEQVNFAIDTIDALIKELA